MRKAFNRLRPGEDSTGSRAATMRSCGAWFAPRLYHARRTVPTWRNWHTRSTQNRVAVRSCGFNSRRRHHSPIAMAFAGC